jgi:hypothetical protein
MQDLIGKIKNILINPFNFFERIRKEKGIKDAFVYLAVLSLAMAVLGAVVGYLFQGISFDLVSKLLNIDVPRPEIGFGTILFWAVLGYCAGLGLSFVWAAVLHVWILIFGGKANYAKTYQLAVYSATPRFVFGWIPIVNYFVWIYWLILLIIGTEKVHELSRLRAVLIYAIPAAALILVYILIIVLAIVILGSGILKGIPAA